MPVIIEIADANAKQADFDKIFSHFEYVDGKFNVFKPSSEISLINGGKIPEREYSSDMRKIFSLAEQTKLETNGYFDIVTPNGSYDPSGIVKGWAIYNASKLLDADGFKDYYVYAGGDIQTSGKNKSGGPWKVGIQNPFDQKQVVKTVLLSGEGIATSGSYVRGNHVYNPKEKNKTIKEIVSLTVIGPNVYEADRFATAAFAMESDGIKFIENLKGFEGYMIDEKGIATLTSGFENYVEQH